MEAARLAQPDDVGAIEDIATKISTELAPRRGGELFLAREACVEPLADRLAAAMDGEDGVAIVGTYDEVVFGYAVATVETLADGRRLGILEDLAVDPEARSSGIGEAIMNLVLDELHRRGCVGVDSRALPGDRETKNFFESFGLKARLLVVHRSFAEE